MLEFNPHFRLSAKEALSSKVFDSIRNTHFEKPCPIKINMKYQKPGVYDYDKNEFVTHDIKDFKKLLIKEIKSLNLESKPIKTKSS